MATIKRSFEFKPAPMSNGLGWFVQVTISHGPGPKLGGFKTEEDAREWIARESALWLKEYEGGRHARSPAPNELYDLQRRVEAAAETMSDEQLALPRSVPLYAGAMQKRDAIRSRAFLEAHIRLQNRTMSMDCVVRNISLSGARLEVDPTFALPPEFELEIPHRGAVVQCALKWRKDNAVGVKFLNSVGPPMSAAEVVEELRRENARLREEIARLKARIQELTSEV
jgi:hypothetical protein